MNGAELASYSQRGVVTPRPHHPHQEAGPLVAPAPESGNLDAFAAAIREGVAKFIAEVNADFAA